ncbi:MAG: Ig-like domain-containing protein, partial [Bacteroidota bacterium]|nr:Ig-like domain-containing protein [Bacteroidota bacterium]
MVPSGFVTNYTFQSKKALADGEYIVTPLIQNAQKADWATGGDHTGNTNGNMFLVNAGTGASQFFYQQVDNLCPGSVYSFSAWLVNVNTITKTMPICGSSYVWPKVTFKIKDISGNVLQSYTTDTLPLTKSTTSSPNWNQYGFQFSLPSGTTSLILEMVDYYGGKPQCGNDLAIDDIVFSACTPTATAVLNGSSTICSGSSVGISSSIVNSPYSNPAYQWQKSIDNGTSWTDIGTPGTSATAYTISSAAVADSGMYRVLVGPDISSLTSATCVTASNSISLHVNAKPSLTISSVNSICSGNTFSISSVVNSGTSPFTYSWTGPNGFVSNATGISIPNISATDAGTYSLILTDTKSCSDTATTTVAVNTTPTVAAITGSNGACSGTQLQLSDATPGGVWSSSNNSIATVSATGLVSLISGGTVTISYTVDNGTCSAVANKQITVAGVTLHPDVIECNNGITHFSATDIYYGVTYSNSNAGNSYAWSFSGGTYSYQGSSNAASQYPNLQLLTGSTFLAIVQFTTNGVTCIDSQYIYKNTVAADTIQGSHDTTICFNSAPLNLSGKVSPVTNVFNWTTTGSGTFSNPSSLTTTYTPSAADKTKSSITIYLSGSSTLNSTGNCGTATSMDSMILRIYPDNVGTNAAQTICSNQVLSFTPSSTIPGSSFSWVSTVNTGSVTGNTSSGTGAIIDSLVNLSNNAQAVVTYTITPFAFTPSNKTCTGTPFTYTVTANPKPAITISNTATPICTGSNTNIQFSSSVPGSTYTWTSAVKIGTAIGNSSQNTAGSNNQITDTLTSSVNTNATVRYYITTLTAAGCSRTDSADVQITGQPTTANAGTDQSLCNVSSALLTANSPLLGTGNWTLLSGPGPVSFGSAGSPSTTINGLVPGTYLLSWSITNGTCAVSVDTVKLVNAPQSVAGTLSADATVCAGSNTGNLLLSGNTGSILRWESSTDGGSTWPNQITDTTVSFTYANLAATTLYRAVIQSGACSSANSNPVTITVNANSLPGILSADTTVCAASNSGTLTISGYKGSIIGWQSSTDGGATWPVSINNTTNTLVFSNLGSTTAYRAIIENGTCAAVYTNPVTITVSPQTIPGTLSASATVCTGSNDAILSLAGYTGSITHWEFSTDNGNTWNILSNNTDTLSYHNLSQTTQYRVLVQSGACNGAYSNIVTITVLQAVTIANAGADQVLCASSSTQLAGNTAVSGTGTWSNAAGNPGTA